MIALEKRLEIGGAAVALAGQGIAPDLAPDLVALELGAVGRGVFHVLSESQPIGAARFFVGYRGGALTPVLTGFVAEARQVRAAPVVWRVVVREPAALLDTRADFHLRHCTARRILAEIESRTGLVFLTPASGAYLSADTPHCAGEGTCRDVLAALGGAFDVPRCVWATLPDGRIFWGDWAAGPFPGAGGSTALEIDPALILERDPEARRVSLACVPNLRAGALITSGEDQFMAWRVTFHGARVDVSLREVAE